MATGARFAVIIPKGTLTESQIPEFEDACRRFGIPAELPLVKDNDGQIVVISGMAFRDAQQMRRQIASIGVDVDVMADNTSDFDEDEKTGVGPVNTLVVGPERYQGGSHRSEEVGDIMSDAWSNLEAMPDEYGYDDEQTSVVKSEDIEEDVDSRTISITAQQILNAVLEADQTERKIKAASKTLPRVSALPPSAGITSNTDATKLENRKNIIGGGSFARPGASPLPQSPKLPKTPGFPHSAPAPAINPLQPSGIQNRIHRASNSMIPASTVAFEVSDVSVTDARHVSNGMIDCQMEEYGEFETTRAGVRAPAQPRSARELFALANAASAATNSSSPATLMVPTEELLKTSKHDTVSACDVVTQDNPVMDELDANRDKTHANLEANRDKTHANETIQKTRVISCEQVDDALAQNETPDAVDSTTPEILETPNAVDSATPEILEKTGENDVVESTPEEPIAAIEPKSPELETHDPEHDHETATTTSALVPKPIMIDKLDDEVDINQPRNEITRVGRAPSAPGSELDRFGESILSKKPARILIVCSIVAIIIVMILLIIRALAPA